MKDIFEVLKQKEEQLREQKQAVTLLEDQVVKLRGAIEIFKEVLKSEEAALPAVAGPKVQDISDDLLNLNARVATASAPTRNWP